MTPGSSKAGPSAPTASYKESSRSELIQALRVSKLVDEAEIDRLEKSPADKLEIAQALVASEALTGFQLDFICEGRSAELRLGNYDLLSLLGAGGMGAVYKARHRRMKRIVALKVLMPALTKDAAFVQRFQREVETIARLSHPNIVMAYDADEAEVGHFLVMEFVDGRDLASLIEKEGPLEPARAVDCILQTARGLTYSHAQGIIHRDIKPHNLLLNAGGAVKITDLGLARLSETSSAVTALTQTGGILGTVDYMPPEQAVDSTKIDHRADVYSLGCTLWHLLTGGPPFVGQSMMSILLKHREAPIPELTAARTNAPPELVPILQRMMAKAPADRYQSMAELLAALEPIAARLGVGDAERVGPPPASPRTAAPTAAIHQSSSAKPMALIVEPSRVQAGIVKKYLEAQGIDVAGTAATGQEALAAILDKRPTVIVAAMHLDDFTGVELARQVRENYPQASPGFVLISSEADEGGSLSRLNRVVALKKPFSPESLAQAVNVVLGQSPPPSSVSPAVAQASIWTRPERKTRRVLLVDDSASARRHERTVLEGLGFAQIAEAVDGAQAIAALARESFDLIVTDYNMPLMDGLAFVTYLKQTPATAGIPVVMVTTETDEKILGPIRALGVAAIFDKTFAPGAVGPALERCLAEPT